MTHYFIEFRFQGKAKHEMKKIIYDLDRKFSLKHAKKKRPIPHVTIIAPFYTNKQKQLVSDFNNICKKHSLIKFKISANENLEPGFYFGKIKIRSGSIKKRH